MATLGTFTAGSVLTAAELNAIGTWTSYTPTFGSPLSIGNATIDFRYSVINNIVFVDGTILFGSTTTVTGSGAPAISLPVNNAYGSSINRKIGYGQINETGVATWDVWPLATGASSVLLFVHNSSGTYVREAGISATSPVSSWAAGDSIHMTLIYRAA